MSRLTNPTGGQKQQQQQQQQRHDSARASPELEDQFQRLTAKLNSILGPDAGINSASTSVSSLIAAMEGYASDQREWLPYAFTDHSRAYTRNLVDAGNGKSNLLLLVWTPGQASPIHDHADAHCVMKILKGNLTETLYAWPCESGASCAAAALDSTREGFTGGSGGSTTRHTCSSAATGRESGPSAGALKVSRSTTYKTDEVSYMSDQLGLHRIANPSETEPAVSLHLYTPPNAAKNGCHIFEESTGKKKHVQQCHFYSEFGVKN